MRCIIKYMLCLLISILINSEFSEISIGIMVSVFASIGILYTFDTLFD
jgi:hypothetical protein